jgi:adenylate cyclase
MSAPPATPAGRRPGPWRRIRRGRLLALWVAGLVSSLAVTGASALGYLESLQARALDVLLVLGGQQFPSAVAVVAIDDAAFAALEARQPISREHLARVIEGLRRSGAAAVGLDVTLGIATAPDEDARLAGAIRAFGDEGVSRVVIVEGPPPRTGPLGDPAFQAAVVHASDRMPVDPDGVIRRVALAVPRPSGGPVPSLALAVLARAGAVDPRPALAAAVRQPGRALAVPAWRPEGAWARAGDPLPVGEGAQWRIAFAGPERSVLTLPSLAVAALAEPGVVVPADNPLRDRLVFVGATFTDSRDFFQTPVGRLPGVEIHATVANLLATRRLIRPGGWLASLALQLTMTLVAGVLLTALRPLAGTLAAIALGLAVSLPASYLAFHGGGYAVDFLLPVVATTVLGGIAHVWARRRLHASFGRYVGRDVLGQILDENPALGGQRRAVSILVSDIRGFTTLSEKLPAETVASHLNTYFPAMVGAIFAHRGTVDDFIGDGILAVFGAPLDDPDHAAQAVRAAVAMQAALARLNERWQAQGLPTLRMGVGVHTGVVFAGNVGSSRERVKYTVIGDAVNAAARLEGLNKDLGTTMLLTEETRALVGDLVETRDRGAVAVKGREEPLHVHELIGLRPAAPPGTEALG